MDWKILGKHKCFPTLNYSLSAIPVKLSAAVHVCVSRNWKDAKIYTEMEMPKNILDNFLVEDQKSGLLLPAVETFHTATLIKIIWNWCKNRNQLIQSGNNWFSTNVPLQINGERMAFLINGSSDPHWIKWIPIFWKLSWLLPHIKHKPNFKQNDKN